MLGLTHCVHLSFGKRRLQPPGARVSWDNICKPKNEGGLGIRKLEEFQSLFQLKRVWNFFSESGCLASK